ncbi:MAG: hypothetical protein KJ052_10020, partial [Candidatus Hydrogenedentes bacterium]|nr:hypothetical protein [Candidatus Hydrogenedentota bacterium]
MSQCKAAFIAFIVIVVTAAAATAATAAVTGRRNDSHGIFHWQRPSCRRAYSQYPGFVDFVDKTVTVRICCTVT